MRLTELRGRLIKRIVRERGESRVNPVVFAPIDKPQEAQGLAFICPLCLKRNQGDTLGVHTLIFWFQGKVPSEVQGGRWRPWGTGIEDMSFIPEGAPTDRLSSGCGWSGFVKNGDVIDA